MNYATPLRELHDQGSRLRVVWLDPLRYSPTEIMYLAARVTRSFLHPDAILARAAEHLNGWHRKVYAAIYERNDLEIAAAGLTESWAKKSVEEQMAVWLQTEIADQYHDSVLEFAGHGYALWISGVSLGTIRDVDRHRLFSFEEYTTRNLGKSLEGKAERLRVIMGWMEETSPPLEASERDFLTDLFYVHPKRAANRGQVSVDLYLLDCARNLLGYINDCAEGAAHNWDADDARGRLPMALRTPFLMAGNQRVWFEACSKRTCYRTGHFEYANLFRGIVELMHPVMPFLLDGCTRLCPKGITDEDLTEGCCRAKWAFDLRRAGK